MGYYTSYNLTVIGDEQETVKFNHDLLEYTKNSDGSYDCEVEELVNTGGVYAKLYDIEDAIGELAKKYPNLLIILEGDGEESDDLWEGRWKGTEHEHQYAKIPPFNNPNLLTDSEKINN